MLVYSGSILAWHIWIRIRLGSLPEAHVNTSSRFWITICPSYDWRSFPWYHQRWEPLYFNRFSIEFTHFFAGMLCVATHPLRGSLCLGSFGCCHVRGKWCGLVRVRCSKRITVMAIFRSVTIPEYQPAQLGSNGSEWVSSTVESMQQSKGGRELAKKTRLQFGRPIVTICFCIVPFWDKSGV